jgi:thermitase
MDPRYRDASALLSDVFSAVLFAIEAIRSRPRLRLLVRTGTVAGVLWMVALLGAPAPTLANVEAGGGFEPREVIVRMQPETGAAIEDIDVDYGSTVLDEIPGGMGVYLLGLPAGSNTLETVERMADDPRLLFAEPNYVAEAPEDPSAADGRHRAYAISSTDGSSEQYAASALNLSCAPALSLGQDTTVAVLDTGAQLSHPALEANFEGVKRYDFVDDDRNPTERPVGLDADGDGIEDEMVGHGTHVAGIVDLVAPSAKIMPLRVLNTEGYGNAFTIAKAISFAKAEGADVINLSLGSSSRSRLLQDVIEDATKNGVVVAAAAGNSNTASAHYPAAADGGMSSADGLVAVTSVDRYEKKSKFANYGIWVDVAAPGNDIRSAFPPSLYADWSGTSMATPFVSGQAALIRTLYGSLDPAGIEKQVRTSARPLYLQDPVYGGMLGAGHADVCASLLKATGI